MFKVILCVQIYRFMQLVFFQHYFALTYSGNNV